MPRNIFDTSTTEFHKKFAAISNVPIKRFYLGGVGWGGVGWGGVGWGGVGWGGVGEHTTAAGTLVLW